MNFRLHFMASGGSLFTRTDKYDPQLFLECFRPGVAAALAEKLNAYMTPLVEELETSRDRLTAAEAERDGAYAANGDIVNACYAALYRSDAANEAWINKMQAALHNFTDGAVCNCEDYLAGNSPCKVCVGRAALEQPAKAVCLTCGGTKFTEPLGPNLGPACMKCWSNLSDCRTPNPADRP